MIKSVLLHLPTEHDPERLLHLVRAEETEEPTLSILARSTIYNIDETKAIFCEGHNLVEPIQWLKPTGEVVGVQTTNNKRIFVEQKGNGAVVPLIIHSIELDDAGNWTCRSGDLNETREFIVGQKVQFNVKNMSVEEEEGNSIKLPCEATGFPAPVVAWYKEKQLIKEQSRKYVIRQDHSLEIKKLNHADVGTYTCKVRQKVLSHYAEKTIQVSVQHKPLIIDKFNQVISGSIKYKTEEVYAILNDTKNVTCRSIANPPPTYTWNRRHDGYDDPPITDPDTVMTSEDGTSSVLILRLYNSSYFGEYKCTVANRKGTESIIYHVSAGTKPDPPDFVALVVANVTELTFNVSCSNCTYPTEADSVTSDPAMILGYSFQLVEVKPGYDPDWTISTEIEVDVVYDSTLYTVGPLKNGTKYHAQVRTRNAAGYSEWVDIPGEIVTLNHAIKLAATVLLVLVAILLPRLY